MSVVLTACRHSKQRAVERALKRKAEKQRKRQQKRTQAYLDFVRQRRLAEQQFEDEFSMDLSHLALSRMWCFEMMGTVYTVVLLLESGKEIVEIFCNDNPISYITDIADGTITFDFALAASKARICCRRHSEGMQHVLTVDGYTVPEID